MGRGEEAHLEADGAFDDFVCVCRFDVRLELEQRARREGVPAAAAPPRQWSVLCVRVRMDRGTGATHGLLFSHPFATKLASTISACVFVMLDLSAAVSRSAASDDTEYDSFGASMMRSTCASGMRARQVRGDGRAGR